MDYHPKKPKFVRTRIVIISLTILMALFIIVYDIVTQNMTGIVVGMYMLAISVPGLFEAFLDRGRLRDAVEWERRYGGDRCTSD